MQVPMSEGRRHLTQREGMAKEQRFAGTSSGLGPHASRRGLLQAGLAIGTLALGQRAALGQPGGRSRRGPRRIP